MYVHIYMLYYIVVGWTDLMFQLIDTSGYSATLYFVLLVVVGSFFLVNLIVAVVYNAYLSTFEDHISANVGKYLQKVQKKKDKREAKRASHSSIVKHLFARGVVPTSVLYFFNEYKGYNTLKLRVRKIVASPAFVIFINGIIVYNMITLAIEVNGTSASMLHFLFYSNFVCIMIFVLELLLRVTSFSVTYFFHSGSNIFDFFIVVFGVMELFYLNFGSAITVLRTMRLFRLIKLMKQWQSLQQFIECIVRCTRGLGPFFVILALFLFICTLSGMSLFAGKFDHSNDIFNSRANFDTFFLSFVTTFQIISGENWNSILLTSMEYDPYLGAVFCLLIYSLGFIIVLNVFLAVMLESFSTRYDDGMSYYDLLEDQQNLSSVLQRGKEVFLKLKSCCLCAPSHQDGDDDTSGAAAMPERSETFSRQKKTLSMQPVKTDPSSAWDGK
jgi:voltage-dependent calcium channel L type alpha-1D